MKRNLALSSIAGTLTMERGREKQRERERERERERTRKKKREADHTRRARGSSSVQNSSSESEDDESHDVIKSEETHQAAKRLFEIMLPWRQVVSQVLVPRSPLTRVVFECRVC